MAIPRGILNDNPLNIRSSNERFEGEVVPSRDPAFKQFKSIAYGYRAAFVIMATYLSRGINTLDKIIRTWAPPNENDTQQYITVVVMMSGVPRTKVLTATSGRDYIKIVAAMSYIECGVMANMMDVEAGLALQNKIRC